MSESFMFFFKKAFLDFPELRLGSVGKQADIRPGRNHGNVGKFHESHQILNQI